MWRYFLKRILLIFPTLFGISIITFLIIKLAPGDPTAMKMGNQQSGMAADQNLAKQMIEQTREIYGLDKPLLLNFVIFNICDIDTSYFFTLIIFFINMFQFNG